MVQQTKTLKMSRMDIRRFSRRGLKGQRKTQRQMRPRFRAFRSKRGPTLIQPIVVPGFTRTSGFFGRFGQGGELKFHDQDVNDATVDSAGTIFLNGSSEATLLRIGQGTSEIQRIGRKVTIRSINWRFSIELGLETNTATPNTDTVRIILYLDKQCNGAAATVTGILESADFQSFNNLSNKSRFRTLMDRVYDLSHPSSSGADATAEWAPMIINDTFFKKVNLPIEYNSTAGAIAEISSNNICMLAISENGLSSFGSKMRLRYSDN